MEEIKKVRYDYIDLLKTIAIMCVICLHSVSLDINFLEINNIKQYICFFVRFMLEGVPIFIFVNVLMILEKIH